MAMKFKSKAEKRELDMTSMIDITFLLIAFFMLLINFTEADQNEAIKLPVSELAKPPDKPPVEPMTIQIFENGNIFYGNKEYDLAAFDKQLDFQQRLYKSLNIPFKKITVIIRADGRCPAGLVQEIIEHCQAKRLENFKLRAKQND